jgi:hypothetical protein
LGPIVPTLNTSSVTLVTGADKNSTVIPKEVNAEGQTVGNDQGEADEGEADEGEADEGEADDGEADDGEADDGEADDGEAEEGETEFAMEGEPIFTGSSTAESLEIEGEPFYVKRAENGNGEKSDDDSAQLEVEGEPFYVKGTESILPHPDDKLETGIQEEINDDDSREEHELYYGNELYEKPLYIKRHNYYAEEPIYVRHYN